LDIVLSRPKIAGLYQNVDLDQGKAGPLGEKLSGGQRQIANIISGLVNPSDILILDEPTNALDAELKKELLSIIDEFRQHKKCIVIITHDRDVYPLMDEKIQL
jgi:ABC-type lipoprotein export system ATPase subunit